MKSNNNTLAFFVTVIILTFMLVISFSIAKSDDTPSRFASGLTINNGQLAGTLVFVKPLTNKIWSTSAVNVAGTEGAIFTELFYTVLTYEKWSLSMGIGPNAEIVNADRDDDPTITYLNACTGLCVNIKPTNNISLHAGFLYISPAHPVKPYKVFTLISFPLMP